MTTRLVLHALAIGVFLLVSAIASVKLAEASETVTPDVAEWADWIGIDGVELQGAVNTTGLSPEEYLVAVGMVERKVPLTGHPVRDFIRGHSRYPYLADCVAGIESTWGAAMFNPTPHHGEHAQGYFGWLPSTARTVGAIIGNLRSETAGFDTMLDRGRGGEFFGLGGWTGRDGTGRCYGRA